MTKMNRWTCGVSKTEFAITFPYVTLVVPVNSNTADTTASGKDDGLKMCAERPSFFQRISSFARKPIATISN